jgi:hypothetical protein
MITERALVGKAKTINKSEMALLSECTPQCAQKELDTADIVRDACLRQLTLLHCEWAQLRDDLNHIISFLPQVLLPSPASQNLLEAWVFAQLCKIWPIFGCDQTRIADCVSFLREPNRFVLFPGGASCPG